MRWKRILWTACLAPLAGGCLTAYHPHADHAAQHAVNRSEREISREIQQQARSAWQIVRCEFPRKMFSAEFHDGFIAGYSDYLDRGGDGQPPAVPPLRYTQNKKYYTPEGHALMRDFLLGFQYGTEIAVAAGQRQFLTVPVLIPDDTAHPIQITEPLPSSGSSDAPVKPLPPPPAPLPAPKPTTKLPMPRTLGKQPAPQDVSNEPLPSKFMTYPPMPTIPSPLDLGPLGPKSSADVKSDIVPVGAVDVKLPPPPREIGDLPDDVPTPPVQFELPNLAIPVSHPEPVKK
jgi:hypothetical protein